MGKLDQKIKNYLGLIVVIMLSFPAKSSDDINVKNNSDMINEKLVFRIANNEKNKNLRGAYNKNPLGLYAIDFTRVYSRDANVIERLESFDSGGRVLSDGEFFKVTGLDNNEYLFDGSFLIQFKSLPNFQSYASENNLVFLTDLSDIDVGIFKPQSILNLETVIDKIKQDQNVISIELNLYHSKTNQ